MQESLWLIQLITVKIGLFEGPVVLVTGGLILLLKKKKKKARSRAK